MSAFFRRKDMRRNDMNQGFLKVFFTLVLLFSAATLLSAGARQESATPLDQIGFQKSGLPITAVPTKLVVMTERHPNHTVSSFNEFEVVRDILGPTNIEIEWWEIARVAYRERINLAFASQDLPDVIFRGLGDRAQQMRYGSEGLLIPLQDLVETYGVNLQNFYARYPDVWRSAVLPGGNVYSLPGRTPYADDRIDGPRTRPMLINAFWLDRLGLDIPNTLEELENVLRAFKTRDPRGTGKPDEIPMSFQWPIGPQQLFGMFGHVVDPVVHVTIENGQVIFTANTEGYKAGIEWLRDMYAEGLIDQEAFVHDTAQFNAKGQEGLYGIVFSRWDTVTDARVLETKEYVPMPPVLGPSGTRVWLHAPGNISHGQASITSAARYPEVAIRFLDVIAEPTNLAILTTGPLGYSQYIDDAGVWKYMAAPAGQGWAEFRHSRSFGEVVPQFRDEVAINMLPDGVNRWVTDIYQQIEPFFYPEPYRMDYYFTEQETEELSTLGTDIRSFILQKQAEWVMGLADIDREWSGYVDRLRRMGLERYVEIHQNARDRYESQR
ncbi:MAG: extracellular solute-binding protein [Spirochaetaceae bacterium]|nr:MAG: extracellular solute-binding protein [Spirochaetaceae bacterium]